MFKIIFYLLNICVLEIKQVQIKSYNCIQKARLYCTHNAQIAHGTLTPHTTVHAHFAQY